MPYFEEKPKVLKSNPGYRLISLSGREYIDCQEPNHSGLRDYICNALGNQLDSDTIDNYAHRYPVSFLATHVTLLESYRRAKDMPTLLTHLRKLQLKLEKSYLERKKRGIIEMSDMPRQFPPNTEIVYQGDDGLIGGTIKSLKLEFSFWSGPYYNISLRVIHAIKGVAEEGIYTMHVAFSGVVALDAISLRLATSEDKELLTKRGKKFIKFCKPGTYAGYQGNITQASYWSTRIYRADGRVVIDPVSFERTQQETWRDGISRCNVQIQNDDDITSRRNGSSKAVEIKPEDYWRCIPFMYGFSFAVKRWGRIELEGLSNIQWRENAFEQLVLPAEDKDLIHSLVKFHGTGFTDIIEGKGGGCIFLLHGEPGFGKTASAEAVAELLHKPLYSVSVGELGVDPHSLEASLRNILDVATIWDAVILLDEADIFLEERDEHDVARNAMVGVFLRLLEYHNGVLFLTTNRVEHFDRAFYSRISIALLYKNEEGKVPKIWRNLLGAAGLPQGWATTVSEYNVNGRQIKNAIRMAQTLARAKGRKPQVEDLIRAVEAALRFQKEIKKVKVAKAE
jgi:ATPase family associated with various cellular activities (AAA)